MSKIFVRERRQVGAGTGQPRLRVVASEGLDMRIYVPHMRRVELEQLATAVGAEIVYLSRGEQEGDLEHGRGHRHGGRQGRGHGEGPSSAQYMQDLD
jgi:hypothetical protein